MEDSKLFKGKKVPSSKVVAEFGYRAMQKGKQVAIHGAMNYIMANSVRFASRNLVTKIARYIQGNP
jgi:short-subunit dehydrogenase